MPRLRVIAGPNGSGKSSVKKAIEKKNPYWLGHFLNADALEHQFNTEGKSDLSQFGFKVEQKEICEFLTGNAQFRYHLIMNLYSILWL